MDMATSEAPAAEPAEIVPPAVTLPPPVAAPKAARRPPYRAPVANPYKASNPQMTQKITLNSRHSTDVYARSYERCAYAIFIISIVIRARGSDEQATEYGVMADERLAMTLKDIQAEQKRLLGLMEASGIDAVTPTYSNPVEIDAPITSPRISRYLQILREFDTAITLIDSAWLQGLISDSEYYTGAYQLKKKMLRLSGKIEEISRRADAAVRKGNTPAALAAVEEQKSIQKAKVVAPVVEEETTSSEEPALAAA